MATSAIEIARDEYQILWAYYQVKLDERERLFAFFLKTVALPSGVVLGLALSSHLVPSMENVHAANTSYSLGAIFLVLFCVGFSAFIGYCFETRNASNYYEKILACRVFFIKEFANLEDVFGEMTVSQKTSWSFDSIAFWRGAMLAALNAAILALSLYFVQPNGPAGVLFLFFALLWLAQALLYGELLRSVQPKAPSQKKETLQ